MRWLRGIQVLGGGVVLTLVSCQGGAPALPQNSAPAVRLSASPFSGAAPLTTTLNADGSDADGTLVRFEWDFDGDGVYDADTGLVGMARHEYMAAGSFTAQVRVTDDSGASGVATVVVEVTSAGGGWQSVIIDGPGSFGSTRLASIGGCPAIAYGDNALYYARASTADGSAASDWQSIVIPADAPPDGLSVDGLTVVAGAPAVAYTGEGLDYTRSTTPDGMQAGSWSTVRIDEHTFPPASLGVVEGRPALAYAQHGELTYAIASTAEGTAAGDWTSVTLREGRQTQFGEPALAIVAGQPALVFEDVPYEDGIFKVRLMFARAAAGDGSEPADWAYTEIAGHPLTATTWGSYVLPALAVVQGWPAVAVYAEWGANSTILNRNVTDQGLRFFRAQAADGSGEWSECLIDDSIWGRATLAEVGGRPAVVQGGQLARSSTPDGTASQDWQLDQVVDGYGSSLAEINGQPAVSYVTDGAGSGTDYVIYAVYLP